VQACLNPSPWSRFPVTRVRATAELEARSASVISEFLSSIFATSVFPLCVFAPQRDKFPFLFPDAEAGEDFAEDFFRPGLADDLADIPE
jgi:hypothetical protein